jgi:4-amino-4-deoxy-L-arabinose transferase-like glycosyltransferase
MKRLGLLLLLALSLGGLGLRGLNEPDESRYGEVAREMLVGGDWLVPRLKGTPHLTKPPLTYWLTAGAQALFGFGPIGMRLLPALAAFGTALLIFDLGRRFGGPRRAWLAALVFLATFESFALGRILTTDMLLTFWCSLALWARLVASRARSDLAPEAAGGDFAERSAPWLFWIALGLGFLTKGPVILLVVIGALLGARWTAPSLPLGRQLRLVPGLLIFVLLGLSWFVWIVSRDPGLADFFLGGEVVDRVARGRGRAQPFWYFLLVLPVALLPFSALALAAWGRGLGPRGRHREAARDPLAAFARGWILVPLVGFSLASSKLWTYLLPLVPAFALLTSGALDNFIAQGTSSFGLQVSRWLLAPAKLLARLLPSREIEGRRAREIFCGLAIAWLAWQGVQFGVAQREERLGHNTSYRSFWAAIPQENLVGAAIDRELGPRRELPAFPAEGLAVASFGLRAPSASFALLGERPEFVPNYEGRSIWKIASRAAAERRFRAADLRALVEERGEVLVLLKDRSEEELRLLLEGFRFERVARGGQGKSGVQALRFHR